MSRAWASASSGVSASLIPAGLAAPARENLGLDDDLPTELRGGGAASSGVEAGWPSETGMPKLPKQLLPLVLVEIHAGRESTPVYPSGTVDKGGRPCPSPRSSSSTATGDTVENAVENGVAKASETLRNIQHVYVDALEAHCEDGRVTAYHVHLKLTFVVD